MKTNYRINYNNKQLAFDRYYFEEDCYLAVDEPTQQLRVYKHKPKMTPEGIWLDENGIRSSLGVAGTLIASNFKPTIPNVPTRLRDLR